MPLFAIVYTGSAGEETTFIDAPTSDDAIKYSSLQRGRVIRVMRAPLQEIRRNFLAAKVGLHIQALVITSIANSLNTGGTLKEAFKDILSENLLNNVEPGIADRCSTAAEFFYELDFHPSVVTAARAGEESDLSGSLAGAARYLQVLAKDQKEYGSKIRSGLVYIIIGLLFLFAAPLMMGSTISTFADNKIELDLNIWSHYLVNARFLIANYFPVFLVMVGAGWVFRAELFEKVKGIPGFSEVHKLSTINRSIEFISNYSLLSKIGMTPSDITKLLFNSSKGRNRPIYNDLQYRLSSGQGIFTAVNNYEWPVSVRLGLKKFDDSSIDDRDTILNSILNSLYVEQTGAIERITGHAQRAGMFTCIFSIVVMAIGFYLPMMGITSAIRG